MNSLVSKIYELTTYNRNISIDSIIHKVNPIVKVLFSLAFIIAVISYDNYQIISLFPFIIFLCLILVLSNLIIIETLKKLLFIEIFIVLFALGNAIFSKQVFIYFGYEIHGGYITFTSLLLKSSIASLAVIILADTTGMNKITQTLYYLKVPNIFIVVMQLMFHYIYILLEELYLSSLCVSLKTKGKGIPFNIWGSLIGQSFTRTYKRANHVYDSMVLRGFNIDNNSRDILELNKKEYLLLFSSLTVLFIFRFYNIPMVIGDLFLSIWRIAL